MTQPLTPAQIADFFFDLGFVTQAARVLARNPAMHSDARDAINHRADRVEQIALRMAEALKR